MTRDFTGAAATQDLLLVGVSQIGVAAPAALLLLTKPPVPLHIGSQTTGGHAARVTALVVLPVLLTLKMMAISLMSG